MNSAAPGTSEAAIFAQANLHDDLTLETLARVAGLSPHHFHRVFKRETGETPAAFVQRLRLEQVAFRLLLHDETVLRIGLDCGFRNPETLSRAFRRHFGLSPRAYRQRERLAVSSRRPPPQAPGPGASWRLSPSRIVSLRSVPIAFLRNSGPYEEVDEGLWRRLDSWANERALPANRMLIGIGHDAPGLTPPEKLRFDACISVPEGTQPGGGVHIGRLPELRCAATTHVGAYATMPEAYRAIVDQVRALPKIALLGLPAVEIYRDTSVDTLREISTTDIHLPVRRTS